MHSRGPPAKNTIPHKGCNCGCKDCGDTQEEPGLWSSLLGFLGLQKTVSPVQQSNAETKLTAAQKINDLADWFNYPQREQFLFNSEINEPMNGSSNSVDHINPVEVQGSEDIMGAESFNFPFQHKNADQYQSGDGRRWISHGGKMVATTFPEGVTPEIWLEQNPITDECGEPGVGLWKQNHSWIYGGYKMTPTYLSINKSSYWSQLFGYGKYKNNYARMTNADINSMGHEMSTPRDSAEEVIVQHNTNYPSQGDGHVKPYPWIQDADGNAHNSTITGCGPRKTKFILGGQPWIDNTGEIKVNGQTWEEHKEEVSQAMEGADFDRRMQMEKEENKKPKESDYDYHARQIKIWEKKLKQGHAREEVKKYFDYHEAQMAHYSKGKGGRGKSGGQQGPQAPHQPGQAPMGGPNMFNTEEVIWPQFTQNISGQGRTFANTIHPGMVIPNPDNYPTPEANNPWAPYVNIRTYGDILNAVYPPYPSAMEWATNPDNYKEYPSTDWYTP